MTDEGDKIALVRLCLQPGSRACNLMQASAFNEPQECKSYTKVRSNFFETYSKAEEHSFVKASISGQTTVLTNAGTMDKFAVKINANRITTGLLVSKRHWLD